MVGKRVFSDSERVERAEDPRGGPEEQEFSKREAAALLRRLKGEFSSEVWKVEAWMLRAGHGASIRGIVRILKERGFYRIGRKSVQRAVAEVAERVKSLYGGKS